MRPSSVVPVIFAALLCVFGCGGGGSSTVVPGPQPGVNQAAVSGNVMLDHGFVSDADVVAFDLTTGLELDRAITDASGNFLLDLPAGEIGLWATSAAGSAGPVWINVPVSLDDVQRDLDLTAGTSGLLIGRVVDTTHAEAISTAIVSFAGRDVSTDGFGFYTFHSVGANPSGMVQVAAPGFRTAELELRSGQVDRAELLSTAFFQAKPNSDTATSVGGVLRDISDGSVLGGAIITLSRPNDPSFVAVKRQTNLGGVWRFYNIPAGSYFIEVRRDGFLSQTSSAVINTRDGVMNLFMDPDPAGRASVNGFVFDFDGLTPLNFCSVIASSGVYGRVSATTNASGSFSLSNLIVDTPYTFIFTPLITRNEIVTLTVTVPSSGLSLNVSLPENGTGAINGRVTTTGQPTSPVGARVEAEKVGDPESGRVFQTSVDANGNYGLNGLPPGRYLLRASYNSPTGPVSLSTPGSTDVLKGTITKRNLTFP